MWLSFAGLVVAGISALFGIWSARDVDYTTTGIARALTFVGMLMAAASAWKERKNGIESARLDEERHRQVVADLDRQRQEAIGRERNAREQFKALHTSLQLNRLEIVWTIPRAPEALKDAIYLADGIFETYSVRDDEFSRALSFNELHEIRASFAIDHAIGPILAALADGSLDVRKYYTGEVDAVARLYRDIPESFDALEAPTVDLSTEMNPVLLLPLNVSLSGALAVGRKSDDPRPQEYRADSEDYSPIFNSLLAARGFGFSAVAEDIGDSGLELRFTYDRKSLEQASQLLSGQMITIAWPDEFNIIIVPRGLAPADDRMSLLGKKMRPDGSFGASFSTLRLVPNGLEAAAVEFDVQKGSSGTLRTDRSTYYDDYNTDLFDYATFHVRRRPQE